jgi:hypothetical protein
LVLSHDLTIEIKVSICKYILPSFISFKSVHYFRFSFLSFTFLRRLKCLLPVQRPLSLQHIKIAGLRYSVESIFLHPGNNSCGAHRQSITDWKKLYIIPKRFTPRHSRPGLCVNFKDVSPQLFYLRCLTEK